MIPAGLLPNSYADPCADAPTLSNCDISDVIASVCLSTGWRVSVEIGVTGSLTGFEIEIWSKEWKDAESEPSTYTYVSRQTSTGTYVIETDVDFSTAGTGASETRRRKAIAYIVPASSDTGSGDTLSCDSLASTQLNRTANICVPE